MEGGWGRNYGQQHPNYNTAQHPQHPPQAGGQNPYFHGGYASGTGQGAGGRYPTGGRDHRPHGQDRRQQYGQHPQGYSTAPQQRQGYPERGYPSPPRQRRHNQAQPPREEAGHRYRPQQPRDDGRMPREDSRERNYRDRHPAQMHQLSTGQDPYRQQQQQPHQQQQRPRVPQPRDPSPRRYEPRRTRQRHREPRPVDPPRENSQDRPRERLPEPQPDYGSPVPEVSTNKRDSKFQAPPEKFEMPHVPEIPQPVKERRPSETNRSGPDIFPQPLAVTGTPQPDIQAEPFSNFPIDDGPHFAGDSDEPDEDAGPKPMSRFRKWLRKLVTPAVVENDRYEDDRYVPSEIPEIPFVPEPADKFEQNSDYTEISGPKQPQANAVTPDHEGQFAEDFSDAGKSPTSEPVFKRFKNWLRKRKPTPSEDLAPGTPFPAEVPPVVYPGPGTNGHILPSNAGKDAFDTITRRRLSMLDVEAIVEKIEEEGEENSDVQSLVHEMLTEKLVPDVPRNAEGDPRRKFARESRRSKLLADPKVKLTGYKKWKYNQSKQWQKTKRSLRSFMDNFTVWSSSFKSIEGHFGSSIVSYFTFVKWLLMVNLFVTFIILAVVVLPQEILDPDSFLDTIKVTNNSEVRKTDYHWEAENCSILYDQQIDALTNQSVWYKTIDFFQGTGWMEQTVLFMGYYFNKTLVFQKEEVHYNMPLAYLLCTAAYFVVTLILMVNVAARGMKTRLLSSGDKFYNTCNKVFCSWDYSLSEEKAAELKHLNLFREYTNDLEEQKRALRRKTMNRVQKCRIYLVRIVVNLLVLALLGACGYLIFQVTSVWMPELLADESVIDNRVLTLLVEFLPSITLTVLNVLIPPIFQKVVILEDYTPETEIRITIARTVLLRLASVAFLVITLMIKITCNNPDYCGNCAIEVTMCWETYFGQQFYKLILLDFIVVVGVTFFVEFPRKLMVRKFPNSKVLQLLGLQEFEIPQNVLDIVYSQTLCWIGGFFSPLVPAITVVKLFIFFYVKKLTLMKNCIPSSRPYRASRSSSFFMTVLMLSFVLCVVPIAYSIGRIPPTKSCGPFRIYSSSGFLMYNVITDGIDQLEQVAQDILYFMGSYLFYVPMMIILSLVIYYYQAMAAANRRLGELLREQMALEGKDKQFLLARVNEALQRGDFET